MWFSPHDLTDTRACRPIIPYPRRHRPRPCPPACLRECPGLLERPAMIPDPRDRRVRRHTWPACWPSAPRRPGRSAGPRSPSGPLTRPGRSWPRSGCAVTRSLAAEVPGEATIRRVLARVDGDAVDAPSGVAGRPAAPAEPPPRARGGRQGVAGLGPCRPPGAPAGSAGPPRRGRARPARRARRHQRDCAVWATAGRPRPCRCGRHGRCAAHSTRPRQLSYRPRRRLPAGRQGQPANPARPVAGLPQQIRSWTAPASTPTAASRSGP